MCGICGIADYRATGANFSERLPAMVRSLHHRGPDDSGIWVGADVGLGHARLSIIDLSDGRQPLSNEDASIWITYNGEVYNFPALRNELIAKGHRFRTRTDTEVIVHLYEEEGIQCVERLNGMFAFGIWDSRNRSIYLVRDRLGIKPLYYTVHNGRLIFGSEIKALLAHGDIPRGVREDAFSDYLTFLYVPAPKTMFRDIFKLPAGHWLRYDEHGIRIQEYWDLESASNEDGQRTDIEGRVVQGLQDSVQRRLVSDVPVGAFLSGGVDSSAVVALMAQVAQEPLITTSIGFDDNRYNELPFARRVSQRYCTAHHEYVVKPDAVSSVEKLAWNFDEPFADYSSIPTYYVSQLARQHVKVVLSGDGGDENFGGYRRYALDLFERRLRQFFPGPLRQALVRPLAALYPKADWLPRPLRAKVTLQNVADDCAEAYCRSVGHLTDKEKMGLFTHGMASELRNYRSSEVIREHMARAPGKGLKQLVYTDLKTYLVDDILTKVDRASMAVSLEVRVPLLDHEFVEFAHRVPTEMMLHNGCGKSILKSAFQPYLDNETLYRRKQGFTPPVVEWLRRELREIAGDLLLCQNPVYADYIDQKTIINAWKTHQSGLRNYAPLIWALFVFELWAKRFLKHP